MTLDYASFKNLIKTGEKDNLDFKIKSDAFTSKNFAANAELAKDICAMANNGNKASYIIVGVSNDGKQFRTVDNRKITDDNIQNYCKNVIYPPPKVKVVRKKWGSVKGSSPKKSIVIIQIGPNKKQIFRIAKDIIDYSKKVCLRRNEVWIRRNATSDLASPEEIILLESHDRESDDINKQIKADRQTFSKLSVGEQQSVVDKTITNCLIHLGYRTLPQEPDKSKDNVFNRNRKVKSEFYKRFGRSIIIIFVVPCIQTLSQKTLYILSWSEAMDSYFQTWHRLPKTIKKFGRNNIKTVRRLSIIPILGKIARNKITSALPAIRWSGQNLFFYFPYLSNLRDDEISSSSEILILNDIHSRSELNDQTLHQITDTEKFSESIAEHVRTISKFERTN